MHAPERRYRVSPAGWIWIISSLIPVAGAAIAAALMNSAGSTADPWLILGTSAVLAIAGMISVPAASGSEFTPAYIVVAALPLISMDGELVFDTASSLAVVAGGLALLWVIRTARGDDQRRVLTTIARRAFAFTVYVVVFDLAAGMPALEQAGGWSAFVAFLAAALAGFMVEVLLGAVFRLERRSGRRRYLAFLTFRDLDVFMALAATGALFGLAFEAIGWWASGVAALPYLFTHGAFRRLEAAKTTYAQTMRSLAQIPEVGEHTHPGHAARTAELAIQIATELGLRPADVDEIELAALMHDIGRVTLNEPNILRMGYTETDLAKWGSEIVGETAYLVQVAEVIKRQYEPYRNPGEQRDPDVPLAARIVKVCSAYDEATAEMGFSPLEAMERLHRGSVYDYDPDVVGTLRIILERRGVFGHPVAS